MQSIRLRFFASAMAAVGAAELEVPVIDGATIHDVLAQVSSAPGQNLAAVLARCSYLLNTVSTTDVATPVQGGDLLDVLPPFAGG